VTKILAKKIVSLYTIFFSKIAYLYRFKRYIFEYRCPSLPKTLEWSDKAEAAFTSGKAALANCTKLVHPTPGAVISLAVDASDTHVGGVLQQLTQGSWLPLAFFSRKLSSTELKYSTFDRELLAAFAAIRHF
jgi:hypothetical protein